MIGVAALAAVSVSGCATSRNHAGGPGIVPGSASVTEPAKTGAATVGYLDIRNNGTADKLVSVTTSVGGTVQLRAPEGGKTTGAAALVMHTVTSIPLPADATTEMDPDSYHLLISGTTGAMHDG